MEKWRDTIYTSFRYSYDPRFEPTRDEIQRAVSVVQQSSSWGNQARKEKSARILALGKRAMKFNLIAYKFINNVMIVISRWQ